MSCNGKWTSAVIPDSVSHSDYGLIFLWDWALNHIIMSATETSGGGKWGEKNPECRGNVHLFQPEDQLISEVVVCSTKLSFPSEETMPSGILEEIHPNAYEVVLCGTKWSCGGYREVPPWSSWRRWRKNLLLHLSTGSFRCQFLKGLSQLQLLIQANTLWATCFHVGGNRLAVLAPLRITFRGACPSGICGVSGGFSWLDSRGTSPFA